MMSCGKAIWPSMELALFTGNALEQLEAIKFFRKLLSQNFPVPVSGIVHLVPRFVELLDKNDQPQIQFEVLWALTNVAYSSSFEAHQLIRIGATSKMINMVKSFRDINVRDQAIWALSNIAGDCQNCRAHLLELGFLDVLITLLHEWVLGLSIESRAESRRTAVWAISNLSRGRTVEEFEKFESIFPLLNVLQQTYAHEKELSVEICWVLVYLTEAEDSLFVINSLIINGLVELIVRILNESLNPAYLQAAIRAAGNIATGTDDQTQHLLDQGILPIVERLLDHQKEGLLREICWLISNLTAGTVQQLEIIISQCRNLFCKLNRIVVSSQSYRVRKEASWAVCNALTGSNNFQLHYLIQCGSIHALCNTLYIDQDEKLLSAVLSALEHILVIGLEEAKNILGVNMYAILIEDCGGLAKILTLQEHESPPIRIKCFDLLSDHFVTTEIASSDVKQENQGRNSPLRIIFNR